MEKGHVGEVVQLGYVVGAVNKTETIECELTEAGLSQWAIGIIIYALSLENKWHSRFIMDGKTLTISPYYFSSWHIQVYARLTQK